MGKYKKPRAQEIKEIPGMAGRQSQMECYSELNAFMECLGKSNFEVDSKCAKESSALMACAQAAGQKQKTKSTMNYHLQRLARLVKRR
mmetsp:Transcript_22670/g.40388  ORF Transcript_22670/g.40388 Transcript_22670/m.40388 type:complete len:88 (-) Transcript_22670:164-427(-)|eukprot:CAMPEP_0177770076 /NCGR_PEP_ID=MMETSP0491_2-20121128/10714_1 /TAXON_ID=63592 /ORGANISM="Tetraselmis chuii, Strain PLY429" /LENGTH=87 /DNA_ID=CAMNT_0019287231 /DNA_START=236 /DNA_END=499 /DNA_ORIENTATION=+